MASYKLIIFGFMTAVMFAQDSPAGILTITLTEDADGAGNISIAVSGQLEFTSSSAGAFAYSYGIRPDKGLIGPGPGTTSMSIYWSSNLGDFASTSADPATTSSPWAVFGDGGSQFNKTNITYSGTSVYLFLNAIGFDTPIESNAEITGIGTITGENFADLGITPNITATTNFTLGNDPRSNTLKVITVGSGGTGSVPEPSTAIAMGLLGIVGFAGHRRRRRQVSVA